MEVKNDLKRHSHKTGREVVMKRKKKKKRVLREEKDGAYGLR